MSLRYRFASGVLLYIFCCSFSRVQAETIATPEAFVRQVYAAYSPTTNPDVTGRAANIYFSPGIVKLLRRDQRNTPSGEVGRLDFDPVCSCQDSDGLKLIRLRIEPISNVRVIAFASLDIAGNKLVVQLTLVKIANQWRIDDAKERGKVSLREILDNKND